MTDERIDIEVQDKISAGPANKLRAIAAAALEADANIRKMVSSMGTINTSAFDKMATASAKVTRATAQQTTAEARLITANTRLASSNDKAAIAAQKLAAETARAQAAQSKAAAAASQASTAANNQARSQLSLAAAQARAASATNAASAAQRTQNNLYTQGNRISRQSRQQLLNLTYQLNDVVVGLASGQKPLTVLLQQGSQISTIFGSGNGVVGTLKQLGTAITTLVSPAALATIAAMGVGLGVLTNEIRKSTGVSVSFGDVFKAVFQVAFRELSNFVKAIPGVSKAFAFLYDSLVIIGKQLITAITAPFVFGYDQIITLFKRLPPALGEIFVGGLNVIVIAFEKALNVIISGVNSYVGVLNVVSKKLGGLGDIKIVDEVYLGRINVQFKELSALASETGANLSNAMDSSRLDKFYDKIAAQAVKNKAARDKEKGSRKETFDDIVQEYLVQINGLRHVGLERERILAIGKAEDKLNRDLTESEKKRLIGLVDTLQMLEMVNEINQPLNNLKGQLPLLDQAFENGLISVDQYRQKVLDLSLEVARLDRSFEGGLKQGLIQIEQQFGDVASIVADGVVGAFNSAENALVDFVSKGKIDFKGFVDSLIADLARLYVRMQILGPLARFLGFAGTSSTAAGGNPLDFLPSFDVGTSRVPRDMIAKIHKDEIIVPASQSRAIRAGKASLGGTGGSNVLTFAPQINLTLQGGGTQAQQQAQAEMVARMIRSETEKSFLDMTRRESKQGGMFNRQNVVA